MALQFSVELRNARLEAIETTMGTAPRLRLYAGAPPANTAAAAAGAHLAEFVLGSDWAAAAANGTKSLNALPLETTAAVAGTIGHYRFWNSGVTLCHEQGTVTATGGGGDMTVDNPTVAVNQTIRITSFTKTEGGA